jgi:uncharacterized protein HemY
MLAIAIILGIAMILNIVQNEGNYNVLMASALVISLWGLCFPLAIVVLVLLVVIGLTRVFKHL